MLKRKINRLFEEWKTQKRRKPLVVKGCRQCGKTSSVLAFANAHYRYLVYLNFFKNPDYTSIFSGSLDVDNLIMMISALAPQSKFVPGETVIVLDEIQECPDARTALKFFMEDGRFDVIATGSLLGVSGYGKSPRSVPVGFETVVTMYPMDFEEFLWANDIPAQVTAKLMECLESRTPVPEALHKRLMNLLLQYVVVGGMPEVVQHFVDTKQMDEVLALQRSIVASYTDDMVKYAQPADKARIRDCFESIPKQLSKENKKFQYSLVEKKGTAEKFAGCLQWIEDAGIIKRCYNLNTTELPLSGNADRSVFKVYMCDTGLFVSMLEEGTQADILQGNLLGYKGAIFENLAADVFTKMGRDLYYFKKDSGLEIDFVMRYKGECVIVEIKATNGNAKSMKTVLKHPENYRVNTALKFGNCNIGFSQGILTLPLYMMFLLTKH